MNLVDWLRSILFLLFLKSYFGVSIFFCTVFFGVSIFCFYINYLFFSRLLRSFFCLLLFLFLIYKVNLNRHERAVLIKNFTTTELVTEFVTVIIEIQCDYGTTFCLIALFHIKLCAAITFPVNWCSTFFIRKGIDSNLISNHKCRVETKTEMTDDLLIARLIFILFHKSSGTRKSNLVNVFIYFLFRHTDTIIDKSECLIGRVNTNFYLILLIICLFKLTHNSKLLKLCNRIASVAH